MKDPRIEKLAKLLINYSVSLKKGEKILIEAFDVDYMLVAELVKEVYRVGGYPFVEMVNNRVQREILMGAGEEECKLRAKYAAYRMNDMDAYIGLRGGENTSELSDIPAEAAEMVGMGIDTVLTNNYLQIARAVRNKVNKSDD